MGRTPTYPLGLPDEQRKRWQAEADKRGVSLAEFIRRAVERDIRLGPEEHVSATEAHLRSVGGKEFKGPDPKVKPRPSSR
jgi:hypothetical protein